MIRLQLIGNIGRDCIVRDVQGSNQKSISFSVAYTEKWKDSAGTQHEKTTWVECTFWKQADKIGIAQYLTKGQQVYVEGNPEARAYTGNDGVNKAALQLRVTDVRLIGGSNRQDQTAQQPTQSQAAPYYAPAPTPSGPTASSTDFQHAADQGDDLPF